MGLGQCLPRSQASLMSGVQACEDYAPQDHSAAMSMMPEYDSTCRALSTGSMEVIRSFLTTAREEIDGFAGWRRGDGWDADAGDEIPSLQALSAAARSLESHTFTCDDQDQVGVTASDELVREALSGSSGLGETDISLINEWMAYDGGNVAGLSSYFCLTAPEIQHNYGVMVSLGVSGGVGFGAGARVDSPIGEIALGCYPQVGAQVTWLTFSYSNNLGLRWTAEYGQGAVSAGVECAARLRIGPKIRSGVGTDSCSGDAQSATWYGPGDFSGGMVSIEGGVDGGVGLNGGVAAGGMLIVPAGGKPSIGFNTSGACMAVELGGGAGIGANAEAGGQYGGWDPQVTNGAPASVDGVSSDLAGAGACAVPPMVDYVSDGMRTLLTRHMYYDTGSSDAQAGAQAAQNLSAIRDITEALSDAGASHPPEGVNFVVTGHASPAWDVARTPDRAAAFNERLAGERANNGRALVLSAYDQFMTGDGWPNASVNVHEICVPNSTPAGDVQTQNQGSSEGLAATGDTRNNDQRFRRTTVVVNVERVREVRHTVPV